MDYVLPFLGVSGMMSLILAFAIVLLASLHRVQAKRGDCEQTMLQSGKELKFGLTMLFMGVILTTVAGLLKHFS